MGNLYLQITIQVHVPRNILKRMGFSLHLHLNYGQVQTLHVYWDK